MERFAPVYMQTWVTWLLCLFIYLLTFFQPDKSHWDKVFYKGDLAKRSAADVTETVIRKW